VKGSLYRIRVRGVLGETMLVAFSGMEANSCAGDTTLSGTLPDQAARHAVLHKIESLGLELLEVRRLTA